MIRVSVQHRFAAKVRLVNTRARDVRGVRIVAKSVSEDRVRRSLFGILRENRLCSIATLTIRNRPHINIAYFCYSDELALYFLSHPGSLHCRNLSTNPYMAITVFASSQQWTGPGRGLQLFGTCREVTGLQARRAEELYAKRFPAHAEMRARLKSTDTASEYRFYRFVAKDLKILDEGELGDEVFVCASVKRAARSH
jgi:uncharacterized protein YhbP (UPF0306 family)